MMSFGGDNFAGDQPSMKFGGRPCSAPLARELDLPLLLAGPPLVAPGLPTLHQPPARFVATLPHHRPQELPHKGPPPPAPAERQAEGASAGGGGPGRTRE